ncbi:MAG: N-acetylmuramoyl-L-alanine amidase [Ancalomicrobiaceae bacterium]|nr:N-acetylmuramoyl-L-alanine amidase [Ancalomicrobiaceae bacterium]
MVDAVRPSPNYGKRRGSHAGVRPSLVVLHYTGMPAGRGLSAAERAIRWLTDPRSEVSSHYVVDEDGGIVQLVPEGQRAWHAGLGAWRGEPDINSASIGIEIVNPGHFWNMSAAPDLKSGEAVEVHPGYQPFPDVQIAAVARLVADIVARNGMAPESVLAHSDIAPARKSDPGEKFPWARLADQGLGLWIEPAPIEGDAGLQPGTEGQPISALQSMLALFGFDLAVTGVYDAATEAVVTAFQRHWRPEKVDGRADRSTTATLVRLLRAAEDARRRLAS